MSATRVTADDGASLAVKTDGTGPDLLLVSGLGGTARFWQPLVDSLGESFRILRFDQRGIGDSDRGHAPCTIATLAADARAVLDQCGSGRAVAVGHSTGGCIVQELARQASDSVAALVLSATWLGPNDYMAALFAARLALLRASPRDYAVLAALAAHPPTWLRRRPELIEAARRAAPTGETARRVVEERIKALLSFNCSAWTADLTQRRFVVGAEDDVIVPADLQRELAAAAPCELHLFDHGGHAFPATRPDDFASLLRAFGSGATSGRT